MNRKKFNNTWYEFHKTIRTPDEGDELDVSAEVKRLKKLGFLVRVSKTREMYLTYNDIYKALPKEIKVNGKKILVTKIDNDDIYCDICKKIVCRGGDSMDLKMLTIVLHKECKP